MRVRLTPSAEHDLEEIETYIARDNPRAAVDTALRVLESLEYLGEHNEMGRSGRVRDTTSG